MPIKPSRPAINSRYAIVTEWDDGTVAVTALSAVDPTPEDLDRLCHAVALEVEGDSEEDELTKQDGKLPCYVVRADGGPDFVYVVEMGIVR